MKLKIRKMNSWIKHSFLTSVFLISFPALAVDNYDLTLQWHKVDFAQQYRLQEKAPGASDFETVYTGTNPMGESELEETTLIARNEGNYVYRVVGCVTNPISDELLCDEVAEYSQEKSVTLPLPDSLPINIENPVAPSLAALPNEDLLSAQIGTLAGQFRVDESGAATYSVPISIPEGIAGVTPQVSLSYSSNSGNGPLGMGWGIGGSNSTISRCRQTYEQDGRDKEITLGNEDHLCLDGQKLIVVNGVYGEDGAEYRTEIDSRTRIIGYLDATNQFSHFEVEREDGSISYYGGADIKGSRSDSLLLSGTVPLTWYLNSTSDNLKKVSNTIFFNYTTGQAGYGENEILIDTIEYSDNKIDFVYSTTGQRPDRTSVNYLDTQIEMTVQLNRVSVFNHDGKHLSSYHLVYDIDTVTQFKRLESIEYCGTNNTPCLPLTTFDWYDQYPLNIESFSTTKSLGDYNFVQVTPVDVNGDGFTDLVSVVDIGSDNYQVNVAYNTGYGTFGSSNQIFTFSNPVENEYPISVQPMDIDGDGSIEFLYYSGSSAANMTWRYYDLNSSVNGSHFVSLGILASATTKDVSFHDVNGDAYPDLVYFKSGSNHIRLNNRKGGFESTLLPAPITMPPKEPGPYCFGITCYSNVTTSAKSMEMLAPADFNGDGRADVVFVLNDAFYDGDNHHYSETFWMAYTLTEVNGSYSYEPLGEVFDSRSDGQVVANSQLYVGQIDNDGLSDLVKLTNGSYKAEYSLSSKSGMSLTAHTGMTATREDALSFQIIDVDRNGRGDFVYFDSELKRWTVHYHTLGGGFTAAGSLTAIDDTNHEKGEALFLADWNGNGELGVGRFHFGSKELYYRQDDGSVSEPAPANRLKTITNGFGLSTEIYYGLMTNPDLYTKGSGAQDLKYGHCRFDGTADTDLDASCTPVFDLISPNYLVEKVESDAPSHANASATVAVEYQYEAMRAQAGGRGILGFEKIRTYDEVTHVTTETLYHQDYPYIGMPKETRRYLGKYLDWDTLAEDQKLSFASNTYDVKTLQGGDTVFPYLDISTEEQYSLDDTGSSTSKISTVTTDNSYTLEGDNYANLTGVVVTTRDASETIVSTVTTTNVYDADDVGQWWLGRVTNTTVTHNRPSAFPASKQTIERESGFVYNATTGMLEKEIIEPTLGGADEKLTTLHCYDTLGNKIESMTYSQDFSPSCSGVGNLQTRASTTTEGAPGNVFRRSYAIYDLTGRYVTVSGGDKFEETSTVTARNEFGQPTQTTDINGVVSVAVYDSFGQQYASRNSLGQASETQRRLKDDVWSDTPAISEDYYFVVRSTALASPTSYAYYDNMGRQVAAVKQGFAVDEWIYQYSRYDSYGRVVAQSVPSKSYNNSYWNSTNYDDFGRAQSITSADGTVSSILYEGLSSTTTVETHDTYALTQNKTEVKNVLGETISVTDNADGEIQYFYDATGNLTKVIGVDNVVVKTSFDDLGRKESMLDPDKGAWSYTYNAAGELISQTDAKLNTTTFFRDSVGRTTKRVVSNGSSTLETTRYSFNAHQLQNECVLSGGSCDASLPSKAYSYDDEGRLDTLTSMLDGQMFTQRTTYDEYGRVFQQFDATGNFQGIRHHYNARGYAYKQVEARNSADTNVDVYYEVKNMDAFGNVTEFRQNNAKISSFKVYDPLTGYLTGIQSDNGALIQDNEYGFDAIGNLRSRTRNSLQNSANAYHETFDYDNLNRLTIRNGQTIASYDDNGNILTKVDMQSGATYQYGGKQSACTALSTSAVAGAHAVTSVGTLRYCYDANGNQIATYEGSSKKRSISYSYFDKPVSIDANGLTTFAYDTGRNRYKRQTTENSVNTTTYYIGNVEMVYKDGVYSETRRYLPDAIQTQYKGGAVHTRYLHKDHLGSIDSITDENGKLVEKLYFDTWGKKQSIDRGQWNINEAFVGLSLGNISDLTPRGFTGHEHVDHADIIHMNGRIYDPTLGRFLQADPHIQAPKNSQSLNRYSYVLNNPLSMTDPSGYFFSKLWKGIKKFIGVIIVAVASYYCAGTCTAAMWSLIGGAAGATSAAVNGGNILTGALVGAFTAGVGAGVGEGMGAFLANGLAGGIASKIQGGNFGHGFWSAGLGSAIGGGYGKGFGKVVTAAVVGGTISKLTGGKFANGAVSAAFIAAVHVGTASSRKPTQQEVTYAKLANDVYDPQGQSIDGYEMSGELFQDSDTGLQSALYVNKDTGHSVFAYAGTNGSSDWAANIRQAFGLEGAQYTQAMGQAQAVYADRGGNVQFVGHSLGGGLATASAIVTGGSATVFNAAGVNPNTVGGLTPTPGSITHFQSSFDGLQMLNSITPVKSYGEQVLLGPAGLHPMGGVCNRVGC